MALTKNSNIPSFTGDVHERRTRALPHSDLAELRSDVGPKVPTDQAGPDTAMMLDVTSLGVAQRAADVNEHGCRSLMGEESNRKA